MKSQLICTFATKKTVHNILDKIIDNFTVLYDKIFVLSTNNNDEVICSYNIEMSPNILFLTDSILVHRKKSFNTIYTINALNEIIIENNNGVLDTSFNVDWNLYRDCLMVTNESGLKRIDTKIFFIQRVKYK